MDDDDDFQRAMAQAGVEPLAGGRNTVLRGPPARSALLPKVRHQEGRFDIERFGERVEGLVHGGDRRKLRLLQRGEHPVEITLDLHGHTEDAARKVVEDAVERSHAAGQRCLLVIHGRGHRSAGAPVLKEALPDWLTGPRCAARVFAFATAPPELGGPGATLVLLRRKR